MCLFITVTLQSIIGHFTTLKYAILFKNINNEAAFLDLHLSISSDILSTKINDHCDDFDFEIGTSHFR